MARRRDLAWEHRHLSRRCDRAGHRIRVAGRAGRDLPKHRACASQHDRQSDRQSETDRRTPPATTCAGSGVGHPWPFAPWLTVIREERPQASGCTLRHWARSQRASRRKTRRAARLRVEGRVEIPKWSGYGKGNSTGKAGGTMQNGEAGKAGAKLVLYQPCSDVWHSRPRLCELRCGPASISDPFSSRLHTSSRRP